MDEDRLQRLLNEAAATYPVPERGPASILEAAREGRPVAVLPRRRQWAGRAVAVAAAVSLLVVGVAVAIRLNRGGAPTSVAKGAATSTGAARSTAAASAAGPSTTAAGRAALPSAEAQPPATTAAGAAAADPARLQATSLEITLSGGPDVLTKAAEVEGVVVVERRPDAVVVQVPNASVAAAAAAIRDLAPVVDARTTTVDLGPEIDSLGAERASLAQQRAEIERRRAAGEDIPDADARLAQIAAEEQRVADRLGELRTRPDYVVVTVFVSS